MPLLRRDVSNDGFEIRLYDSQFPVADENPRFLLWIINSQVNEKWHIYAPDSPNLDNEIVDGLKFQGVKKTLKNIGKRTPLTSLNINGRMFKAERISVDFTVR
jgi:hypothetical protein